MKNCLGVNFLLSSKYGAKRFYFLHGLEEWDWKQYVQRKKVDNKWLSVNQGTEDRYDRRFKPYDDRMRHHHIPYQYWIDESDEEEL